MKKSFKKTDFEIIYENYNELAQKLNDLVKGNIKNFIENDFGNFTEILLQTVYENKGGELFCSIS